MAETPPAVSFAVDTAPGLTIDQSVLDMFSKKYENFLGSKKPKIESIEEMIELTDGWLTIESQADMNLIASNVVFGAFLTRIRARITLADFDVVEVKIARNEAHLFTHASPAESLGDTDPDDTTIISLARPKPTAKPAENRRPKI
jgi:hypothetical protein